MRRLAAYPIILIVCWTPATINRISNALGNHQSFDGMMAQTLFVNLNGACNAIAYGLSDAMQADLKACCCPDDDSGSDESDDDDEVPEHANYLIDEA